MSAKVLIWPRKFAWVTGESAFRAIRTMSLLWHRSCMSLWASRLLRAPVAGAMATLIIGLTIQANLALAQTPHSQTRTCNYAGGPACPETPAALSPWIYNPNGFIRPTPLQMFSSLDEFENWLLGYENWCAGYVTGTSASNQFYADGILTQTKLDRRFPKMVECGLRMCTGCDASLRVRDADSIFVLPESPATKSYLPEQSS
jgi:hypothetical protein